MPTTIVLRTARIFFAAVFIFSGFVKAVDPLGSTYKFQDFLMAFGVEWLFPAALPLAVLLSALEFVIGFAFLFGLKMQVFAPAGLALMAVFTPATIFIALTDPVPHCGCFGDAIVISNPATAFKNVLLFAAAAVVFFNRRNIRPLLSGKNEGLSILAAAVMIAGISLYGLTYLPVIDFRPWKVGNNIAELIAPPEEASRQIVLVFKNRKTGETRDYPADDYPWDDPEWAELWEYKDRKEKKKKPDAESPIANFSIMDESGLDLTESFIGAPGYLYLVVAYDLNTTRSRAFDEKLAPLAEMAMQSGRDWIALTASPPEIVHDFRKTHDAAYPFFFSDERALKTIIRSNPGLVVLKDGVVIGKWPYRKLPSPDTINSNIANKK